MLSFHDDPILLVDDEPEFLQGLSLTIRRLGGYTNIVKCTDSRKVKELLGRNSFGLAIFDLVMPGLSGRDLLEYTLSEYPEMPVIMLSGVNQVETAVDCMKIGAFDFYSKTGEAERLVDGIRRALNQVHLRRDCERLKQTILCGHLKHPEVFKDIVASNEKMIQVFRYLEAVADSPEPVLIVGETGVGKELVAKALHHLAAPGGPWVAVNVAGLDDHVFADTLFGHVRGAYTGAERDRAGMIEQAQGGTLFLDEIGSLSPGSQVKLLRLLQEKEYHPLGSDRVKRSGARIVCATNSDLKEKQAGGGFRKDLYFRLRTHQVEIPPLRDRKDDLPLLLERFLEESARLMGKKKPTAPPELHTLLALYSFPGNVRELRAMVYDAVSLHEGKILSMRSFEKATGIAARGAVGELSGGPAPGAVTFHDNLPTLKVAAELLVLEAMRRTGGNQTMAAKLLGITQPSLSSRLKKMGP